MVGSMRSSFLVLLFCSLLIWRTRTNECRNARKQAASMSKTCCNLTRPSLDDGYATCDRLMHKQNAQLGHTPLEKRAHLICIYECLYEANAYTDTNPPLILDMTKIEVHILKYLPEPRNKSAEFLLDAYRKCEQFRRVHSSKLDITVPKLKKINVLCNPFAMQIETCVQIYAMQECPEEFYLQTSECKKAQTYFMNCIASVKRF